jgi:hypothetical protein
MGRNRGYALRLFRPPLDMEVEGRSRVSLSSRRMQPQEDVVRVDRRQIDLQPIVEQTELPWLTAKCPKFCPAEV